MPKMINLYQWAKKNDIKYTKAKTLLKREKIPALKKIKKVVQWMVPEDFIL